MCCSTCYWLNTIRKEMILCLVRSNMLQPAAVLMILDAYAKLIKDKMKVYNLYFILFFHVHSKYLVTNALRAFLWLFKQFAMICTTVTHNTTGLCCQTGKFSALTPWHIKSQVTGLGIMATVMCHLTSVSTLISLFWGACRILHTNSEV